MVGGPGRASLHARPPARLDVPEGDGPGDPRRHRMPAVMAEGGVEDSEVVVQPEQPPAGARVPDPRPRRPLRVRAGGGDQLRIWAEHGPR